MKTAAWVVLLGGAVLGGCFFGVPCKTSADCRKGEGVCDPSLQLCVARFTAGTGGSQGGGSGIGAGGGGGDSSNGGGGGDGFDGGDGGESANGGGAAVGNDAGHDAGTEVSHIVVNFKVAIGARPFSCASTYTGIGTNPDAGTFRPKDARFYVHDVRLLDSSDAGVPVTLTHDGQWQDDGVALIDAEDFTGTCASGTSATNLRVVGTVPVGTYTGLMFKVGLPAERNHLWVNDQPPPLNVSAMYWSWTAGYRFIRIEGVDATGKSLQGGLLFLGSTACVPTDSTDPKAGATCTNPNVVDVSFASFDTGANTVVLDLARLFQDTDLAVNTAGTAGGCMSGGNDPDCVPMFRKLGLPLHQEDGGVILPADTQSVFTKG